MIEPLFLPLLEDPINGHKEEKGAEHGEQPTRPLRQGPPSTVLRPQVAAGVHLLRHQLWIGPLQVPRPAHGRKEVDRRRAQVEDVQGAQLTGRVVPGEGVVVVVET